jgi:hypothetical protein
VITSYSDQAYFCLASYTDDREFYILTTNTAESEFWETYVFSNNPQDNSRDFESLLEQIPSESEESARYTHKNILFKWNHIEAPVWIKPPDDEEILGIGEGTY